MNEHYLPIAGLFFDNPKEIAAATDIFSKMHFKTLPIASVEELLAIESQLHLVMLDEAIAKKHLKTISVDIKGKGRTFFLPIIIILENEQNIQNWLNSEVFDVIVLPLDKIKIHWCLQRINAVKFRLDYFKMAQLDNSQKQSAEHELAYLAYHDMLTGLANRSMLENSLSKAILFAKRAKSKVAVLFLDLDYFKNVNDSMGHHKGDNLLKEVAKKLQHSTRETDLVARQGGDEFVIILNGVSNTETINQVAQKIRETIEKPFLIDGQEIYITTSIGISVYPENGKDAQTLLKNADIAMYLAKEYGRNTIQFCTPELSKQVQERVEQESSLRIALNEDQLLLHYQPKLEMATGKITGVEALLRWKKPDGALVYPGSFIALAEETGLIVPITEWVIQRSLQESIEWNKIVDQKINLAINLSLQNLKDENIILSLKKILKSQHYNPDLLQFEITESLITRNLQNTLSVLNLVKNMGIKISIDDFGTGYSSLSYLKQFNVDELKIDKTFIDDIVTDQNDAAIVKAIIAMAHSLNIKVVAEGVETHEQFEILKKEGCDQIQGYYFSRPLPLEELLQFLKNYQNTHKKSE